MKPLILTGYLIPEFTESGYADLTVNLMFFQFVWGPLPSQDELAAHLGPRTASHDKGGARHWSDWAPRWKQSEHREHRDLSLGEFCQQYDSVELWFDTWATAQLLLVWLLDYFRSYPKAVAKLKLRLVDQEMIGLRPGAFPKWQPPMVDVAEKELVTASAAWEAYRSKTPEACFDLLRTDLSELPQFKPVLLDLLGELPSASTGLGATEMLMLEMVARGHASTNSLFVSRFRRRTCIFREFEHGDLLDGLAHGPHPAVAGLDDELHTLDRENYRDRLRAYQRSRLSLTEFGKAVVAHKEDFSRHNPIDRWWGGTHLTNDNLWRWDSVLTKS